MSDDMFILGHVLLEKIFFTILAASWQASVLAVFVIIAQRLLGSRLNPRWHYALWLLVVLRLVLPVLPASTASFYSLFPSTPMAFRPFVDPYLEKAFYPDHPLRPLQIITPPSTPNLNGITVRMPRQNVADYNRVRFVINATLALAWFAGMVLFALATVLVNYRFARHVAHAPQITDESLRKIFADAKAELGLRRHIRLVESSHVSSPAIMGLFTPTLLLPDGAREKFTPRELRFIFLHELAHLKRGDVFVQALIALLQIIHWFNPVLWYAFRRLRADREPATDALVLSRTGEADKEPYGLMLLKLLEHFNQRHALPTLVGILEDKDQFKRRFSLIARFTRGAYGWSLLGVLLIAALAALCLTKAKADTEKKPAVDHVPDLAVCFGGNKLSGFTLGNLAHSGSISDGTTIPSTGETLSVWRKDETSTNATLVFIATKPTGPAEKRPDGSVTQSVAERREEHVVPLGQIYTFRIFDKVDVTTAPTLEQLNSLRANATANATAQKGAPVRLQFLAFDAPADTFTGPHAANNALKAYEQSALGSLGGGANFPKGIRPIGSMAEHTRMGQLALWISGPNAPGLTAQCTPRPDGKQISLTGTLAIDSQQWSGDDAHRKLTTTPIPNASYLINLDLEPQLLHALQPDGILEPDAAHSARDKALAASSSSSPPGPKPKPMPPRPLTLRRPPPVPRPLQLPPLRKTASPISFAPPCRMAMPRRRKNSSTPVRTLRRDNPTARPSSSSPAVPRWQSFSFDAASMSTRATNSSARRSTTSAGIEARPRKPSASCFNTALIPMPGIASAIRRSRPYSTPHPSTSWSKPART
jgi:bla regulator protein BlaR1